MSCNEDIFIGLSWRQTYEVSIQAISVPRVGRERGHEVRCNRLQTKLGITKWMVIQNGMDFVLVGHYNFSRSKLHVLKIMAAVCLILCVIYIMLS